MNDFLGLNYYQPQRVMKNDTEETLNLSHENVTGAPAVQRLTVWQKQSGWMTKPIPSGDGKLRRTPF